MSEPKQKAGTKDRIVMGPQCEKGHQHVLRIREAEDGTRHVTDGVVGKIDEGKPIGPGVEIVKMVPDGDGSYECETLYRHPGGPAKVTTEEYRSGWDALWGQKAASAGPN